MVQCIPSLPREARSLIRPRSQTPRATSSLKKSIGSINHGNLCWDIHPHAAHTNDVRYNHYKYPWDFSSNPLELKKLTHMIFLLRASGLCMTAMRQVQLQQIPTYISSASSRLPYAKQCVAPQNQLCTLWVASLPRIRSEPAFYLVFTVLQSMVFSQGQAATK